MTTIITITDMTRSLSDVISRVYYKGETFDIKKGVQIVARLSPVSVSSVKTRDLNNFFKSTPHLDKEDIVDFTSTILDYDNTKEKN